ncbi:hypothetical protein EJ02DRAFT_475802 [Clathrospora elynae]|uniref:Uncharacterized protein n=1 Tax=Clathrospora elynae TaxID=706981 RepID=A0A6A5T1G5_9PLEO|nr:hypothetical protein EJ02DRAFT_475802 [Clathrospora elynae]
MTSTPSWNQASPSQAYMTTVSPREDFWSHTSPIPDWRNAELQPKFDLGYWNAKFGLYGAQNVTQAQFDELKRIIEAKTSKGRLAGKKIAAPEGEMLDPLSIPEKDGGFFVGIPSLWSLPMVKFRLPKI